MIRILERRRSRRRRRGFWCCDKLLERDLLSSNKKGTLALLAMRFIVFLKFILCMYFGPCFESHFFSILSVRKEDIEYVRIITCAIKSDSQSFAVRSPNPKLVEKECPLD